MKRVEIGKALTNFAGVPLKDNTKEGDDKNIYARDILIQFVGQLFQAENKERAILAYKTAQKIYDAKFPILDLEDAEYKLCQDALDPKRMSPMVFAQVTEVLDAAVSPAEEKAVKEAEKSWEKEKDKN